MVAKEVVNGIVPLSVNIPAIQHYHDQYKKFLGPTKEAVEFRRDMGKKMASVADNEQQYEAEFKRYCGTIINTDIDLMIYTTSIATALFEVITVTGNDVPSYTTWITPEVDITRMPAHGNPPAQVKFMSGTQYFPQFYMIATPRIYQNRRSILTGNTGPDAKIDARARYEIEQEIEDDIWTLLTAALGAFGAGVWVYDNRIQNLPTTNTQDFSAEGGLTKNLFQLILAEVDKIPSRSRPGSTVSIRNMFIPSSAAQDIRAWVSVVSAATGLDASQDAYDTVTPDLQRDIESNGPMIGSLWGERLGLRKVTRLMGTTASDWTDYLWVFFDEPVGRLYLKTDEDRTDRLVDQLPYLEGYVISRVLGMEVPDPYTPNFMRVKFQ
jgi:hypothetical protein